METIRIELTRAEAELLVQMLEQMPLSGQVQALRPVVALINRVRVQIGAALEDGTANGAAG